MSVFCVPTPVALMQPAINGVPGANKKAGAPSQAQAETLLHIDYEDLDESPRGLDQQHAAKTATPSQAPVSTANLSTTCNIISTLQLAQDSAEIRRKEQAK